MLQFILILLGLRPKRRESEVDKLRGDISKMRDERVELVALNQRLEAHALEIHKRWTEISQQPAAKGNLANELVLINSRIKANRSRIDELAVFERACNQRLDAQERRSWTPVLDDSAYDEAILDLQDRNSALRQLKQRQAEYEAALVQTPNLSAEFANVEPANVDPTRQPEVRLPPDVELLMKQIRVADKVPVPNE